MEVSSKKAFEPPPMQFNEDVPPPPYAVIEAPTSTSKRRKPWWKKIFQSQNNTSSLQSVPHDEPVPLEDELHLLGDYDTFFVIDDSTSMRGSKWEEASMALQELVTIATKYDEDGIDLAFLNRREVYTHIRDPSRVDEIFQKIYPSGATPTGHRLGRLLTEYLAKFGDPRDRSPDLLAAREQIKPINYIVVTDGSPTDDPALEICRAAKRLDDLDRPLCQLGIQFIQIGNSAHATRALNSLDDELKNKNKIRDIVDTTPYQGRLNGEFLVKGLLGGINRRWDKVENNGGGEHIGKFH